MQAAPVIVATAQDTLSSHFTWLDWAVVVGYLALTTWLGGVLAGRQATIRDFFLGGRKLPWYAVCGSIIATEISAVTFVGVPAIVFAPAGNFTFLQIGLIGYVLARLVVGYVFVPVYYEREIYSPYDYMAHHLGKNVRTMTTCLFIVGGLLAQGARVFLTAMIVDIVIGRPVFGALAEYTHTTTMAWSIVLIGVVAIAWTLMGGITTVIWTDVILFLVFLLGAIVALLAAIIALPGSPWDGIRELTITGWKQDQAGPWGKFTFFNLSFNPAEQYTLWTAAIGATWLGLAAFGTDQLMAQRMFCCRDAGAARKAILASNFGQIITVLMLMVGLGLFAYYRHYPLAGEAAALVARDRDNVFPVFIVQVLPSGVTGLIIGAIFAAAISSMDSILAALAQTTLSAFYLPWLRNRRTGAGLSVDDVDNDPSVVRVSRVLVVFWGVMLCVMAYVAAAAKQHFPEILNLALSMAGYANGALLAGFMLAFLKLPIDGRGFLWSGPLSVLLVFAVVWHDSWAQWVCWAGAVLLLTAWLYAQAREGASILLREWPQTLVLTAALALTILVCRIGYLDRSVSLDPATGREVVKYVTVAWPWFVPIGSTTAFVLGYLLARRKPSSTHA